MITYTFVQTSEQFKAAALLFNEYALTLNISLSFQHFEEELLALHEMYSAPSGGIILALDANQYVGCVAIRKINEQQGELKRMYVKPSHRNKGIGKQLLEAATQLAKDCGYQYLKLDTLNYMHEAIKLYTAAGFYEVPAYYFNPEPTAVYFEKQL
ncbi:MAG: GNAT family N-acetyltransferase [Ferruginibacter sp.]